MGWGGGKGKSNGGKSWSSPMQSWGGGKDKGWGGKGKRKTDPEKSVWIGGLPEGEASIERNKELVEHMKQAGECKFVKVGKSGTGIAVFSSADEVQYAVAALNGSQFQGSILEVDVWTKKDA
mmetsp:Transcript_51996/g.97545  ORF Transcript_51996/g.97545 Transcript_51996/m.97545 type:complete len:122 (-) Transcript_51996:273-638(-)